MKRGNLQSFYMQFSNHIVIKQLLKCSMYYQVCQVFSIYFMVLFYEILMSIFSAMPFHRRKDDYWECSSRALRYKYLPQKCGGVSAHLDRACQRSILMTPERHSRYRNYRESDHTGCFAWNWDDIDNNPRSGGSPIASPLQKRGLHARQHLSL
jgi:hypothetical protein